MRHLRTINHLGRKSADRKSLMANMASSLILHKRITTSVAKARALRSYVEPLLTKSKEDSTNSRRVVFSYLENKSALSELFREVAPKIASRPAVIPAYLSWETALEMLPRCALLSLLISTKACRPVKLPKPRQHAAAGLLKRKPLKTLLHRRQLRRQPGKRLRKLILRQKNSIIC